MGEKLLFEPAFPPASAHPGIFHGPEYSRLAPAGPGNGYNAGVMKQSIAIRLLRLNREFYDQFARDFSTSRAVLSPGILRALRALDGRRSLLDLGCGDGRVGRALATGLVSNRVSRYRGVDFSEGLLGQAQNPDSVLDYRLLTADLAAPGWSDHLREDSKPFEAAVCFSVLFHIPGRGRCARLLRELRACLSPGGLAVISVWQFLHVASLRKKIVPWNTLGLTPSEVDPGDLLVDWRRGGRGLRYVHHFEEEELVRLCTQAGLTHRESFSSDGRTGDMTLFLVLERA